MKKTLLIIAIIVFVGMLLSSISQLPEWGFFGHRKINRMAVFTLPTPMIGFFKKHIEYLTDHAVDPDKRRYATKHEAVRHYIDIDVWEEYPFDTLPQSFVGVLMKYSDVHIINEEKDTFTIHGNELLEEEIQRPTNLVSKGSFDFSISKNQYRSFFYNNVLPKYYDNKWTIPCDSLMEYFGEIFPQINCSEVVVVDTFSQHGILPYHLQSMQSRLTKAFRTKNKNAILRTSAEMGHYVGDAHVPLHTTKNYNGQLTDQIGIHGFWESRIPELLAEKEYDFFVGKAEYIEDTRSFFWKIIGDSHVLVDSVLQIEKEMSQTFPSDQQYCFEKRNELTIRQPCKEYAIAYARRMQGMVEKRMSETIHNLGSVWYTAWVDAGQPDLSEMDELALSEEEIKEKEELENSFKNNSIKGREH